MAWQLVHQVVIDVQTPGGVDDHDVEAAILRFGQSARRALDRIHLAGGVVDPHAGLLPNHRQLLDRGRTAHVGRHEQRVPTLLGQPSSKLR